MGFTQKKHLGRYKRLRDRQPTTAWSDHYQAGIRATRTEAPTISRPTRISRLNRFGRTLHALSIPERTAILLALYNPNVFALLEQFVLSPGPSPHPMQGHPRFAGMNLPPLPGTVSILDGLGELDRHPVVRVRSASGEIVERPDLFVVDLILGLMDKSGPYCIHQTVKADRAGFQVPLQMGRAIRKPKAEQEKFDLRMRIERLYFYAAGVPTREFPGDQIDRTVVANLMRLFSWSIQPTPCHTEVAKLKALICATDLSTATPHQLSIYVWNKLGVDQGTFKRVLHGLVWDRVLRVDLFTSLLMDQPWYAERRDVLEVYHSLFAR